MRETIVVESVLKKDTSEGKQDFVLRSGGQGYFWWREALPEGVEEGRRVRIDFIQGKYPKIMEMQLVSSSAQAGQPAEANGREQSIIRSVVLKVAVNTLVTEGKKTAQVIRIAEEFCRWLKEK